MNSEGTLYNFSHLYLSKKASILHPFPIPAIKGRKEKWKKKLTILNSPAVSNFAFLQGLLQSILQASKH